MYDAFLPKQSKWEYVGLPVDLWIKLSASVVILWNMSSTFGNFDAALCNKKDLSIYIKTSLEAFNTLTSLCKKSAKSPKLWWLVCIYDDVDRYI